MILRAFAYWNCKRYKVIISDLSGNWDSRVWVPLFCFLGGFLLKRLFYLVVSGFGGISEWELITTVYWR